MKRSATLFLVGIMIMLMNPFVLMAQDDGAGIVMTSTLIENPSVAGIEGYGVLRFSYKNIFPGNKYKLNKMFLTYDSYFEGLHGGASFFLSNDSKAGMINDLHTGLSYAYHFKAGDDFYISAGLSASLFHRGFNFGNAVLPDQIDSYGNVSLVSGETLVDKNVTVPDISTGFMFMFKNYYVGLSVSHLTQPDLSGDHSETTILHRSVLLHAGGTIPINKDIKIDPVLAAKYDDKHLIVAGGLAFGIQKLSTNAIISYENSGCLDLRTGLSFDFESFGFNYAYKFNLLNDNKLLPISVHHQIGISVVLNNLKKRKAIHTITIPKI